ncbi:Holliday junction resolvase RuvX [Patescibacteria group bacterium]|nr:Holliday junction resolvase RuvX [Patescibacteria group bacterium]MBU0964238.1 Holliday junction resolvase RuvX [Patescibacteria group bacterium]
MPKIIGIDYGEKRVGLALSSEDMKYSFDYKTIIYENKHQLFHDLKIICQDEGVGRLVIGLPLDQDGQLGKKAQEVKEFSQGVSEFLKLPFEFEDERFSTALVKQLNREAGKSEKRGKKEIDQQSAKIILQTYLDRKHG